MITRIYKSTLFKCIASIFIAAVLNGCTSSYMLKKLDSSEIDGSSILKIYLNDGRSVDFKDRNNINTLLSLNENELTYKNHEGVVYKLLKQQIERVYNERFSVFNTILCIVGILTAIFLIILAAAMGAIGNPGG